MAELRMFRLKYGELRFGRHGGNPSGPVVVRKLSPEEYAEVIAKYGPPNKNKGKEKNTWADLFYEKTSRTGKKGSASNESSASV